MSLRRKITTAIVLTIIGVAAYFGYSIVYSLRQIPVAYAAWDTGTLLIDYMKSNEGKWPSSWDDLLSIMSSDSGKQIMLRGSGAGDTNYAFSLRNRVAVDWKFDPAKSGQNSPVTRLDGTRFPVVWAEPNEMIRAYLKDSMNTNASKVR